MINSINKRPLLIILIVGFLLELGMQTFIINEFGPYISPHFWVLGGLAFSVAALLLLGWSPVEQWKNEAPNKSKPWLAIATFSVSAIIIAFLLAPIFEDYPVKAESSDIIPSIQLYVQRFLGGEYVYAPLEFSSWTVQPTYLPMMWLPYCFSELLKIDYRWTAYLVFLFGICTYLFKIWKHGAPEKELAIKAIIPFLVLLSFILFREKVFGFAVELMPAGLYLILCASIWNKRRWFMAIAIVFCLLSRYGFSFWLPLYALFYLVDQGWKKALEVVLWGIVAVSIIYVIPFLSKDWGLLQGMLEYYQKTAVGQWHTQPWQEPGSKPFHLSQGLSYALYFFDGVDGPVEARLAANKAVHFWASSITALCILIGFFVFRKRNSSTNKTGFNPARYTLVALKLYLVVFYSLLYVPFGYLYMLPLLVGIPIIYEIPFSWWNKNKTT